MLSLQRDILLASQALLHGQAKLVPAFSPRRPTEGERGRGVQEHAKDTLGVSEYKPYNI